LMGSSSQHFYGVMRIAKRIEQAIKMKKIGGPTMDSRTIMRDESEDDSQLYGPTRSHYGINYSNAFVKD